MSDVNMRWFEFGLGAVYARTQAEARRFAAGHGLLDADTHAQLRRDAWLARTLAAAPAPSAETLEEVYALLNPSSHG